MNAKRSLYFILMPLQIRRSEICSLQIGQLYHNASLLWYNERKTFIVFYCPCRYADRAILS